MSDEITDAIAENAEAGLKSVTVDGQTTTAMDIDQQIKADEYLRERAATGKSRLPIRMFNTRPPGAT